MRPRTTRSARQAAACLAALALAACQNDPMQPPSATAPARATRVGAFGTDSLQYSARVRCGQPTHVWMRIVTPPYNEIYQGETVWFTGVVVPGTGVQFGVYDGNGALRMQHTTRAAGSNCVIAHELEARTTYELEPGVYSVYGSYYGLDPYTGAIQYVGQQLVQTIRVRESAPPPPPPIDPVDPCPFGAGASPNTARPAARPICY